MSKDERNRILDEYNNGTSHFGQSKKAKLLEYIQEDQPLDSIHQLFVGVFVRSSQKRSHGNKDAWAADTANHMVDVMDDDSGEIHENVP